MFVTMVLAEMRTAQLRAQLQRDSAENRLQSTAIDIKSGVEKLGQSRNTSAYQGQYAQNSAPLIDDVKLREQQRGDLVKAVDTHVSKLQEILSGIHQKLEKEKGKPVEQILNEAFIRDILSKLVDLKKEREDMFSQLAKLQVNTNSLQSKLDDLHHQIFILLPPQERAGLKTPAAIAPPKPEAPKAESGPARPE